MKKKLFKKKKIRYRGVVKKNKNKRNKKNQEEKHWEKEKKKRGTTSEVDADSVDYCVEPLGGTYFDVLVFCS